MFVINWLIVSWDFLPRAWAFGCVVSSYKGRLVDALGQSADEGRVSGDTLEGAAYKL